MTEASLLFPLVIIAISLALTGYIYHRDITRGVQSSHLLISRLVPRLVQRIDKTAKYTAHWTYNIITGQHADNANLEAGEYELVKSQSPGRQHGLPLAPSDGEFEHSSPSGVGTPSIIDSPGSPDSQVRALLSSEDSGVIDNDLWEILVRSGRQAQSRRSRENRHDNDHQHRPAVNMMADGDIRPADWEIDAAGRRDHAWFHGMVDRVVDKFQAKLEPEVVEVLDSV